MAKKALLIVDVQNDFCPGGALGVADGDKVVEPLMELADHFDARGHLVLLSRDWHPAVTSHFAAQGGPWPVHCVRGTEGAQFHAGISVLRSDIIISKAMGKEEDGYSPLCANAFVDPNRVTEDLGPDDDSSTIIASLQSIVSYLLSEGVEELYIGGLATDYCVKAGVLDALKLTFIKKVYLLTDAIGAVNIKPADGERAIVEMVDAGAVLTTTTAIIEEED